VVPARQIQVVQSLEGGIISEILVSEGTMVEQGQPWLGSRTPISLPNLGRSASGRRRWLRASSGLKLKRKASLSNFRLLEQNNPRAVASEKNV
jgi:adhesin transport system membrane fusion protein